MPGYAYKLLVACDQLLNALLDGWPDETLSSRCWRWHKDDVRSWPCRIIDALFWWDREQRGGHDRPPLRAELGKRAHRPPAAAGAAFLSFLARLFKVML